MKRIVLVGASGTFGTRLAMMAAKWPDAELVLAARRTGPLEALKARLEAGGAKARIMVAALERADEAALAALAPFAVADASGPFQTADLSLPRAALAAGAHYVDIADGRAFVRDFGAALWAEAVAAGRVAITGASSTPALSVAALRRITRDWARVDTVETAISPGARAPRGLAVVQAILSWVGRPVMVFEAGPGGPGQWMSRPGWSGARHLAFPGLGRRWVALADTPDLDALPRAVSPTRAAVMRAGLEVGVLQFGVWLISWLQRLQLGSLRPLSPLLRDLAGLFTPFGSDRGGMIAVAAGLGPDMELRRARWSLTAEAGDGISTPAAAAAAVLRGLMDGRLAEPGARSCAGLLDLAEIVAQLDGLSIRTRIDVEHMGRTGLFPRLLGGFETYPGTVRRMHGGRAVDVAGRAAARGSPGIAAIVRAVLGVPGRGRHPARVTITPDGLGGEVWTRRFGNGRFRSHIRPARDDIGGFVETVWPARFRFRADPCPGGFAWVLEGWTVLGVPLPMWLAPTVRARTFARDGVYRFSVLIAHPLAGVVFAYAGRLEAPEMTTP